MTARGILLVTAAVVFSSSCGPAISSTSYRETTVSHGVVRTATGTFTHAGDITSNAYGIRVALTSADTCLVSREKVVRRVRIDERKLDRTNYYTGIGVAAAAILSGLFITIDARNVPTSSDRIEDNPVGKTGAYVVGLGLLGIGAATSAVVVRDRRRARRVEVPAGERRVAIAGSERREVCNTKPAPGLAVALLLGQDNRGVRKVDLGMSGPDGTLLVPWGKIPEDAFVGDAWVRKGVFVVGPKLARVGVVDLAPARARLAQAAWAAVTVDSPWNKYLDYSRRFPRQHLAQVRAAFGKLRVKAVKRSIAIALIGKKLDVAKLSIDEWRRFEPDSVRLVEVTKLYMRALETQKSVAAWAGVEVALTQARAGDFAALARAKTLIVRLSASAGARDYRIARLRRRLRQATQSAVRRASVAAIGNARRGTFTEAGRLIDAAAKLQPKSRDVARAVRALDLARRRLAKRLARLPAVAATPSVTVRSLGGSRKSLAIAVDVAAHRRLSAATVAVAAVCKVDKWEFRSAASHSIRGAAAGEHIGVRVLLFAKPSLHGQPTWCSLAVTLKVGAKVATDMGQYCWRAGQVHTGACK